MGVLSFLSSARRKADVAPSPAEVAYTPKRTVDTPLEKIEARFGASVQPAAARIREAFAWHRTGRKADAFAAFHAMLTDPLLVQDAKARVAIEGEIFGRLRLCYEREGCFSAALVEAAMAYAMHAKAYAVDGREEALQKMRDPDFFDRYFKPLLERARLPHASVKFRAIVDAQLKTLPMVDVTALREVLDQFHRNPPPPPKRVVERVAGRLHIAELHGA
jgi:hypothetical protein